MLYMQPVKISLAYSGYGYLICLFKLGVWEGGNSICIYCNHLCCPDFCWLLFYFTLCFKACFTEWLWIGKEEHYKSWIKGAWNAQRGVFTVCRFTICEWCLIFSYGNWWHCLSVYASKSLRQWDRAEIHLQDDFHSPVTHTAYIRFKILPGAGSRYLIPGRLQFKPTGSQAGLIFLSPEVTAWILCPLLSWLMTPEVQ